MSALRKENLLTLSAAAKELPFRPHASTLQRWVQFGIRGVRLETLRIGGRRYTSREALQRFIDHLSGMDRSMPFQREAAVPPVARKNVLVDSRLDALGIK